MTNNTTSTATTSINSTSNSSSNKWKDLPYRICTICIGIPILWYLWCHDTLRVISFHVIHSLCTYEYIYVMTVPSTTNSNSSSSSSNNNSSSNRNPLPPPPPHLSQTSDPQSQPLRRQHRPIFMIVSSIILCIPTLYFVPSLMVILAIVTIISITTTLYGDDSMNQMIIWCHGILFITIPFRSWITVATSSSITTSILKMTTTTTGFKPTISLLFTVWNCDTGALLLGRWFGTRYHPKDDDNNKARTTTSPNYTAANRFHIRHVVPSIRQYLYYISPSKSFEGLLGGIWMGTMTYAYLLPQFWYWMHYYHIPMGTSTYAMAMTDPDESHHQYYCVSHTTDSTTGLLLTNIGIGLLLSAGAVLGDLLESTIKRYHHCKDSGLVLPGHGGIYDRFDSSLISIVLYHYCILSFVGNNSNTCSMIPNRGY